MVKFLFEKSEELPPNQRGLFEIFQSLKLGIMKLNELGKEFVFSSEDELEWMFGMSWNLAIQAIELQKFEMAYMLFRECAYEVNPHFVFSYLINFSFLVFTSLQSRTSVVSKENNVFNFVNCDHVRKNRS